MSAIILNDKPAVKVNAKPIMWGSTEKARLFDIDGDQRWVSRKYSHFNEDKNTLVIEEWLFKKMFPKG